MNADDPARSIPALAQWAAARYGDAEAVVDGGTRLTFRELAALARQATRAAMAAGIEPGDRVAIWAPNSWEWIVAALGTLGAGGVARAAEHPVQGRRGGVRARPGRRAAALHRSAASSTPTTSPCCATRRLTCAAWTTSCSWRAHAPGEHTFDDYLAAGDAIDAADADARIDAVGPDDVADVIFTSGTTGRPKGVMLDTRCVAPRLRRVGDGASGCARATATSSSTRSSTASATRRGGWRALQQGATDRADGGLRRRPPARARDRRADLGAARAAHALLVDCSTPATGDADLSSLRLGVRRRVDRAARAVAAHPRRAAVRDDHHRVRAHRVHRHDSMCRSRRRPETMPSPSTWRISERAATSLEGIEVAIAGEPARSLVRGYNVMRGYFEDPDATARRDRCRRLAAHRRHRACIDDDGVRCGSPTARRTCTSVGGFNAYPAEVENLLLGFDDASPRSRWSACPTTASGRWAWRSSCRAPGRTIDAR